MPFDAAERALWPETDYSQENSATNELYWGFQTRVARVFAPGDVTGVARRGTADFVLLAVVSHSSASP